MWKRHRRDAGGGTWDRMLQALLARADAEGKIDWTVSIDATNTTRPEQHTGGTSESHESA